jgi:hypothetical protein
MTATQQRLLSQLADQLATLQAKNVELRDKIAERGPTPGCAAEDQKKETVADPFDFVLSLEEHFVDEGHADGLARGREMGLDIGRDLG